MVVNFSFPNGVHIRYFKVLLCAIAIEIMIKSNNAMRFEIALDPSRYCRNEGQLLVTTVPNVHHTHWWRIHVNSCCRKHIYQKVFAFNRLLNELHFIAIVLVIVIVIVVMERPCCGKPSCSGIFVVFITFRFVKWIWLWPKRLRAPTCTHKNTITVTFKCVRVFKCMRLIHIDASRASSASKPKSRNGPTSLCIPFKCQFAKVLSSPSLSIDCYAHSPHTLSNSLVGCSELCNVAQSSQ